MKLAKFGGSSVASAERIKHIFQNIILPDKKMKYVVLSTFGKKDSNDIKITDQLEKVASKYFYYNEYPSENIEKIKNKYYEETKALGLNTDFLNPIFEELDKIIKNKFDDFDRYYAAIVSQGERMFVSIPAAYLKSIGVKAEIIYPEKCGLITDSNYRNASLLPGSLANLKKYGDSLKADIIIIPGFYAIDKNGDFTTFRRGGSDFTGAIASAAFNVECYENFTDVNGILRVDPNLFKEEGITVETIKVISYREVRELAYGGAKVLHSGTLKPLEEKKIPLRIRNTFEPSNSGTLVVPKKEKTYEVVKGIAARDKIYFLNIMKQDMDNEIGIGYKIEKSLFEKKISFTQITSSIDSLSYAIAEPDFADDKEKELFQNNLNAVVSELRNDKEICPEDVSLLFPYSLVYIVGEGMHNTVGLFAKFSKILSQNKINIYTTYQVPEQLNVIFGVSQNDSKKAVKELYRALFVNKSNAELSLANENIEVALKSAAQNYSVKELNEINSDIEVDVKDNKIIFTFSNIFSEAEKKYINSGLDELQKFKITKESVIAKTKQTFQEMIESVLNCKITKIYFEINYEMNERIFFITCNKSISKF
ncbi:MAG TPA: aspartate kinase [bacterium]|nr:aspartate kinase [bacterium]HPN30416.1 aspartate kinase [bacterium]